jgi:hypothetical protein
VRADRAALTSIAALVVLVRPTRSARRPARIAPDRPATPTAAKTMVPVSRRAGSAPATACREATTNAGSTPTGTSPKPRTRCGVAEPSGSARRPRPSRRRGCARTASRPGAHRARRRRRARHRPGKRDGIAAASPPAGTSSTLAAAGGDRRSSDRAARLEPVGEVQQGRRDAAGDEPDLHRDDQPRCSRRGQAPVALKRGHDRRGAEPCRVGERRRHGDAHQRLPRLGERGRAGADGDDARHRGQPRSAARTSSGPTRQR